MSIQELVTGPGWHRRFGLTWLSAMVLVSAGVVNAFGAVVTAKERPAASTETVDLGVSEVDAPAKPRHGWGAERIYAVERIGTPLTVDLIDAHEGARVELRVAGCTDEPVHLVREGAGFPIKLWDIDPSDRCVVQARRKDGLFWTRWTQPARVGGGSEVAVALPRELAGGIGVRIAGAVDGAYVHDVEAWTPAWQAGLERGDVIATVDGRPVAGLSTDQIVELVTGPVGTSVELGIVDVRSGRALTRRVERRYME